MIGKDLGSWILKNIPEIADNVNFLKIAERAEKVIKPVIDSFNAKTTGGNTIKNSNAIKKILQNELNIIYKNGGDHEKIPGANKYIKKLYVDALDIVGGKKFYDTTSATSTLKPETVKNYLSGVKESRTPTEATKEALRIIKKNRSRKEFDAAEAKKKYTEYYKPGGANDRFLMIKNVMETEFKTINEATSDMLDFVGRKKQKDRDYHNVSDILSLNLKKSFWNNNKDMMKKHEPKLFNFIDSEINYNNNDLTKIKKLSKKKQLRTSYGTTPQSKFIKSLATNPRIKRFFSEKVNDPNYLQKHHLLGKEDAYRLADNLDKKDVAMRFRAPTNLTTKKRNEKIAEELRKKIQLTMLAKDRALQKLINSNQKELFGTPNSKDIVKVQGFSNRIEMLSSTAKDFGIDLAIPDSKGKIKYYGGQYDNVLQLKESLKDNIVPGSKDKKILPSYNKVKNLQKGGLLDIEEMLESD